MTSCMVVARDTLAVMEEQVAALVVAMETVEEEEGVCPPPRVVMAYLPSSHWTTTSSHHRCPVTPVPSTCLMLPTWGTPPPTHLALPLTHTQAPPPSTSRTDRTSPRSTSHTHNHIPTPVLSPEEDQVLCPGDGVMVGW